MISSQLKTIMKECGLTQVGLAGVLDVSLDRVKSLTSGRVKNLKREEGEALIRKLGISATWLATGELPMFMTQRQKHVRGWLDVLADSAEATTSLRISDERGRLVMELMYFARTGDAENARLTLDKLTGLDSEESALLEDFRRCASEGKKAVRTSCSALAQANAVVDEKKPAPPKQATHDKPEQLPPRLVPQLGKALHQVLVILMFFSALILKVPSFWLVAQAESLPRYLLGIVEQASVALEWIFFSIVTFGAIIFNSLGFVGGCLALENGNWLRFFAACALIVVTSAGFVIAWNGVMHKQWWLFLNRPPDNKPSP